MKSNKKIATQIHDLDKKANYLADYLACMQKHESKQIDSNEEFGLKTGDIIEFWAGYDNDIRYRATIHGFDEKGQVYVNWDCYWFPINLQDKYNRDFKKVA